MKSFRPAYPVMVLLAAIVCFGLRWGYTCHYASQVEILRKTAGDAADYFVIAYTLGQTGKYARPANADYEKITDGILRGQPVTIEAGSSDSWRPPLWPFVLMLIQKAAGTSVAILFALRFLLDVVTLLLFARLLTYFPWPLWLKGICLFTFALHPTWLLYSSTFVSEPLSMLMLVAFTVALFHLLQAKRGVPAAVGCGILGGLVILTHPFFLFLPFLVGAFAWHARLLSFRRLALLWFVAGATIVPWLIRNAILYRTLTPVLTTSSGNVLAMSWNSTFLSVYRNTTAEVECAPDPLPVGVQLDRLDAVQVSAALSRNALVFVCDNWRLLPALVSRKLVGAITPVPETYRAGILEQGRMLGQMLGFAAIVYLLARKRDRKMRVLLLGSLLGYMLMAVITYASIRFRAPLVWLEVISIASAFDCALGACSSRATIEGHDVPRTATRHGPQDDMP